MSRLRAVIAMLVIVLAGCTATVGDAPASSSSAAYPSSDDSTYIDDSVIDISSPDGIPAKRKELIDFIWGTAGMPADKLPASVEKAVVNPLPNAFTNLARVDHFVFDLGQGLKNEAFHFVPRQSNGTLVIVHQGHANSFAVAGLAETIALLVGEGYGVLGAMMPCFNYSFPCKGTSSDPSGGDPHGDLFATVHFPDGGGDVMQLFVEHLVESLHYLRTRSAEDAFPSYGEYDMLGLSGGGWTTQIYAALDPSIRVSIPASGGTPLYLRRCLDPQMLCPNGYDGDAEQMYFPFYKLAGYLDLYAMGASGPGRRQVQVQIRHDACCFGQDDYPKFSPLPGVTWDQAVRADERQLQTFLQSAGGTGWYRFEIDETSSGSHVISPGTRLQVILAELGGERRPFGASSPSAIYARGGDGELWRGPTDWMPLHQTVVGSPAVIADTEVVLRDESSNLVHLSVDGVAPQAEVWSGIVASEPAAARVGDRLTVVAVRDDARLWAWQSAQGSVSSAQTDPNTEVAGTPVLVARGAGQMDAFVRRTDEGIEHVYERDDAPWVTEQVGDAKFRGLPTAMVTDDGSLRVFARGVDDRLWEARQTSDGTPWQLRALADADDEPVISGSPSALVDPGTHETFVAARAGSAAVRFVLDEDDGSWSHEVQSAPSGAPPRGTASLALSPQAVAGGILVTSAEGNVWFDSLATRWSYDSGTVH